jgi:hypothetical protein
MEKCMAESEVSIGKFDILATYAYARALLDGKAEPDAKVRGIVAASMGARISPPFLTFRYLSLAMGAIGFCAIFELAGRNQGAHFVGHWVPTILILDL